jgi:hypothetical protein
MLKEQQGDYEKILLGNDQHIMKFVDVLRKDMKDIATNLQQQINQVCHINDLGQVVSSWE